MSRTTDRSQDPSPFAWIFGAALAFVALGAATRAVLGRGDRTSPGGVAGARTPDGAAGQGDDEEAVAGHPS